MASEIKLEEQTLQGNWQREVDSGYLYRKLSGLAKTDRVGKALVEMADQEDEHAQLWAEQMEKSHPYGRQPQPDLRVHLTLLMARMFGAESVLGLLVNDEVTDIVTYASQARQTDFRPLFQGVLSDETNHARRLSALKNPDGAADEEPWHHGAETGGWLRDVVYGFNDGLTANFGLVMGVVGAAVNAQTLLLAGFSGLLADALSMAASGFLAARSEQEVHAHELALEEAELRLMPESEKNELAGFYMEMGLTKDEAHTVADRLMQKPQAALTQLSREELGIDPNAQSNPLQEGIRTGIATGLGAVIPILPFLFLSGAAAVWTGVGISMLAHWLVGASRAVFTGRPALRSGFEMFAVGMGVALVTFLLGKLLGVGL
jgi:VIT1/CCC1 family predicted Fe2+/Mn2+ transporter/rubrerythrin